MKCMSPLQSVQCVGPRGGGVGLQTSDFRILTPLNGVGEGKGLIKRKAVYALDLDRS